MVCFFFFFFSRRRRHTISLCDCISDVCSSDLAGGCTYNTWLRAIGAEEVESSIGDIRITQMKPEDIAIITNNINLLIQENGSQENGSQEN